jgi:hypothetical protein
MDEMPYVDAQERTYRYGDFFPFDMSPCGYNQSQAFEYFPLTESEAKERGYRWTTPEQRSYTISKKASDLPESIIEVGNEILNNTIQCQHAESGGHSGGCDVDCATAFRITQQELDFYRKMNLPLPRLCFNCRHVDRTKWRNAPGLYHRQCMCDYQRHENSATHAHHQSGPCPNEFETSYPADQPEIVYCEQCYQAEVS